MQDLTFGEQVKIILGRKGMTIKQLAELIEEKTGKKMSRQNLTQRLGRDNFQEQDMRMIAEMLECPFHLSIMSAEGAGEVRSIAALERAAAARVEAVEASGHKELTAKEQAEAEYAEPEEKLIEETVPEMFEHTEEFAQNKAEAEYIEPEEPVEAEYIQTEEPVEAEYIQPEEPVEAEYIQPEESVEAEYIQPEKEADMSMPDTEGLETPGEEVSNDRDMTIGELYEIHEELNELEKNVQAGESIEEIKKELEKPKKERRLGSFFRRRDSQSKAEKEVSPKENEVQTDAVGESGIGENVNQNDTDHADKAGAVVQDESVSSDAKWTEDAAEDETAFAESGSTEDFEPVITHDDVDEDTQAGDVNPYTGKEYQSNSVRMHPTRIGYVQVYDRTIHKWTDMTEWAFLGLQERKKALLGKAYEPPIYLD
ncbi:hypothetical protein [[Ruminococcus] torques]|jgi:regulator of replication initiation timing|uniref:hypothetical protein n=1 Tax=[Ruminococcus] torques TaxID=33039 RepID=UPI003521104E